MGAKYYPVSPLQLSPEWIKKISDGAKESLKVCGDPMSVEFIFGQCMTGAWTLYVIVTQESEGEAELAGFFTAYVQPTQGVDEGPWVNLPVTWTDGHVVRRNGAGAAENDVIQDCLREFAKEVKMAGMKGIQFASPRKGYAKVARSWGFVDSGLKLWRMEV